MSPQKLAVGQKNDKSTHCTHMVRWTTCALYSLLTHLHSVWSKTHSVVLDYGDIELTLQCGDGVQTHRKLKHWSGNQESLGNL